MLHTRAPAFYRFDLGNRSDGISDGPLNFPTTIFRGAPATEIRQRLSDESS